MSMSQVQFHESLSMAEFMERYGTEAKCHAVLVASRWPEGFRCRRQTTVTASTVFEATKLPLTRWFLAMYLMTQAKNNVSVLELMRHLRVR